jgi:hypothetical protein
MAKRLKICLAMGGGVSLGSYSGAALTEALKLLILYGRDNEGDQYSSVEVDGMSGASAGSIALAIMMRCLIDYESLLKNKDVRLKVEETVKELEVNGLKCPETVPVEQLKWILCKTYDISTDHKDIDTLVALEVTQIVQKKIWVDILDTSLLFGTSNNESDDFGNPFGLLSRNEVIQKAKSIIFSDLGNVGGSNKKVLSERALMAFTMANLSPIAYGEKRTDQEDVPELVKNLQNATSINNHNEIRVFDFWFNASDKSLGNPDPRYLKIPDEKGRNHSSENTWAEILASAVASGAFPIGFPPAVLTKYKEEYDEGEWPKNKDIECVSDIPDSLNFAYVDGGTFNNEPIKEAFKLGAFIDFQRNDPGLRDIEDRLILFVDPSVPAGTKASQLKSLDPFSEIKNKEIKIKPDSKKMVDVAIDLVGMVASQGEINEEAKIQAFYKSSMLNDSLFQYFKELDVFKFERLLNTTLLERAYYNLENSLQSRHISIGTRDVSDFVAWKYAKICKARIESKCLAPTTIHEMYQVLRDYVNKNQDVLTPEIVEAKLRTIIKNAGCNEEVELQNFGSSIFLAIAEMALNQFGKDFTAERAGILPVNNNLKIEALPGSDMAAFAGFASKKAREICFAKGRLDSAVCLEVDDFRKYHYNTMLREGKHAMSYIDIQSVKTAKTLLSSKYLLLKQDFTKEKYLNDINENMRPKIVDRVSYVINNILENIKEGQKSGNIFSMIKKGWQLYKIWKNVESKKAIENLISEEVISDMLQNRKNIAIKIQLSGLVNNIKFDKGETNTVQKGSVSYFKIYLVMVSHLQEIECEFIKYCYLSSEKVSNRYSIDKIDDIAQTGDSNQIKNIEIAGFPNITSEALLKAFTDNFNKFKYGINPVFKIDQNGNISIDDLSKPLAEMIVTK